MSTSNSVLSSVWPSPFSGWYTTKRDLTPYTGRSIPTSAITPQSVKLAMLRNAPAWPDGFDAAFLELSHDATGNDGSITSGAPQSSPIRILVDSSGGLYTFDATIPTNEEGDIFVHITSILAARVQSLPDTGSFRNSWSIKHHRTSLPIDRLFVRNSPDQDMPPPRFKQITVSGYHRSNYLELSRPVDDYTTLPRELNEIFGLILEVLESGRSRREVENEELIAEVKKIVTACND